MGILNYTIVERFWRDRIADEIAAMPSREVSAGMEPEDYAEAVGYNTALGDAASRVLRGFG